MSRVTLIEPVELSPFLRDLHDAARDGDWSTQHVARAFAAQPQLLEDYLRFYYPWGSNTGSAEGAARLEPRLKELVRLRIATLNGCVTCKAARLQQDTLREDEAQAVDHLGGAPTYTAREQAAIAFGEKMALDHHSIGDADIRALRELFDEAELLELMMMAGQFIGFGRMLAILQLEVVSCPI